VLPFYCHDVATGPGRWHSRLWPGVVGRKIIEIKNKWDQINTFILLRNFTHASCQFIFKPLVRRHILRQTIQKPHDYFAQANLLINSLAEIRKPWFSVPYDGVYCIFACMWSTAICFINKASCCKCFPVFSKLVNIDVLQDVCANKICCQKRFFKMILDHFHWLFMSSEVRFGLHLCDLKNHWAMIRFQIWSQRICYQPTKRLVDSRRLWGTGCGRYQITFTSSQKNGQKLVNMKPNFWITLKHSYDNFGIFMTFLQKTRKQEITIIAHCSSIVHRAVTLKVYHAIWKKIKEVFIKKHSKSHWYYMSNK